MPLSRVIGISLPLQPSIPSLQSPNCISRIYQSRWDKVSRFDLGDSWSSLAGPGPRRGSPRPWTATPRVLHHALFFALASELAIDEYVIFLCSVTAVLAV